MFQMENTKRDFHNVVLYFLTSLTGHIPLSAANSGLRDTGHRAQATFTRRIDRQNFRRRRILLARVLNDYFLLHGMDALSGDDVLELGEAGKPRLLRADGTVFTNFNLSFRSNAMIVGISAGDEIGVDIEDLSRELRPASMAAVMDYYFLQEERAYVDAGSGVPGKCRRFLELWTRKEAAVKTVGQSIISHGLLVNSLNEIWLGVESDVRGRNFTIPGNNKLLASVATTGSPLALEKMEKKDARILFGHHHDTH